MATTKSDPGPKQSSKARSTKQVFDVAKPGNTPASATSRPLLVEHRAMMRDPLVAGGQAAEPSAEESAGKLQATQGKVIQPSETPPPLSEGAEAAAKTTATAKETINDHNGSDSSPSDQTTKPGAVDVYANQAAATKKEASKEEDKKQAEIAEHIEKKTYHVPIGQVKKRRTKRLLLVLLLLLALLAAAYLAVDAGLIDLNVDLPYEIL